MIQKIKIMILILACQKLSLTPTGTALFISTNLSQCDYDRTSYVEMEVLFEYGHEWRFHNYFCKPVDDVVSYTIACDLYDIECRDMMAGLPQSNTNISVALIEAGSGFQATQIYSLCVERIVGSPTLILLGVAAFLIIIAAGCITFLVYKHKRQVSRENDDEIVRLVQDMRLLLDEPTVK